jgi:hypothetical protein
VRWFHVAPDDEAALHRRLLSSLPADIEVAHGARFFEPGSLGAQRMGSVVLLAHGERFLAEDGASYDHGSTTPEEVDVPYAIWSASC